MFLRVPDKVVCSGVCHGNLNQNVSIYAYRCNFYSGQATDTFAVAHTNILINEQAFVAELTNVPSSNLDKHVHDADTMWENGNQMVTNMHAPTRSRRAIQNQSPWINQTVLSKMRYRDYLKKPHDDQKKRSE